MGPQRARAGVGVKLRHKILLAVGAVVVAAWLVLGEWTMLSWFIPRSNPRPTSVKPAPAVAQAQPAAATWYCNGVMGSYEIDTDVPGRIHAWLYVPGFQPGKTVIVNTANARRTRP